MGTPLCQSVVCKKVAVKSFSLQRKKDRALGAIASVRSDNGVGEKKFVEVGERHRVDF